MEISKSKLSLYSSLSQSKMRRKHGLFTVEGEKAVSDISINFEVVAILYLKGYKLPDMLDIPNLCYEVSEREMKQLSNLSTPSPVMGVFKIPESSADTKVGVGELCIVLDGIQDPGNMGTIIRTCHWFGIRRIFASHDTVDIYNPKTVQATMGSLGRVSVTYCDLESLLIENKNLPVYGMLLDGEDIFKATLEKRGFIVLGNEGSGISEGLRTFVTHPLLIPPGGPDHGESLNVAIAGAVTLTCFARIPSN